MVASFNFAPIGILRSVFTEKFGVPRQSLMVSEALGVLKLSPDPRFISALKNLEQFTHLWLVFVFHQNGGGWRPLVETPRLDAGSGIGVFATRSPHRPNPIGMSVVRLEHVDLAAVGGPELHLSGVDLLDGTPVLDIKPYLPYADAVDGANAGWTSGEISRFEVEFSPLSLTTIAEIAQSKHPRLLNLLKQTLEWDPRPTSQRKAAPISNPSSEGRPFAFRILGLDVRWMIRNGRIYVTEILPITSEPGPS